MTLKGRHWVMLWLLVALVTLASVAWRQTGGISTARALRTAREERAALEAQRGELERRIRQASSRQVLVPRAESSLGLHEPAATEMTVLSLPAESPGGLPADALQAPRDSARKAPVPARPAPKAATRRPPARRTPARAPARAPARKRPH